LTEALQADTQSTQRKKIDTIGFGHDRTTLLLEKFPY
jgi:hypothetical protein